MDDSSPAQKAARLRQEGQRLLREGKVGRALVALRDALALTPDDTTLYPEFLQVCLLAEAFAPARQAARAWRKRAPQSADAAYQEGMAALLGGDAEGAARALEEAAVLAPRSVPVRLAQAKVEQMRQRPEAALPHLEKAHALEPGHPGAASELALALVASGGARARAREVLQRALAAWPQEPGLHLNLALVLAEQEPSLARHHAERARQDGEGQVRAQAERLLARLP